MSQATSLFDYAPGQTTATFTNRAFPNAPLNTAALPQAVQNRAAAAVTAAGITDPAIAAAAILDYLSTGDSGFIADAAVAGQQAGTTAAVVVQAPVPVPTLAITANATSVLETVGAATGLTFTVTLTAPLATATTVNYVLATPDSTYLAAADFGGVAPAGQLAFAAGQTSAIISISVPAAALAARPDASVEFAITATDATPVSVPTAQTVLVNPLPVAGPPAIALFLNETDGAVFSQSGSTYTLDLGTLLQGQTAPLVNVAVANTALAGADSLSGSFSAPTGSGFIVTGNDLPGAIAAGQLYLGLFAAANTDRLGAHTETLVFTSRDVNQSGFQAAQAPITLILKDNIATNAGIGLNTPATIVFGNARTGTVESQAVSVTNAAAIPAAALTVAPSAAGASTVSGMIAGLAAGQTDTLSLRAGLSTAQAGAQNGSISLNASSANAVVTGPNSGGSTALANTPVINVFGLVYVGDPGTIAITVANTDPADGYSESLIASLMGSSAGIGVGLGGPVAAIAASGSTSALSVTVSTQQAATIAGTVTLALTTDGGTGAGSIDGLGQLALAPVNDAVTITVDNYAKAAISQVSGGGTFAGGGSAYTLDFGTVQQGATVTSALAVTNAVTGPADGLSGAFALSAGNAINLAGFGTFMGLGAGQSDTALGVTLDTSAAGRFGRTVTLNALGSNASGYTGPVQTETLTITGTVSATAAATTVDLERACFHHGQCRDRHSGPRPGTSGVRPRPLHRDPYRHGGAAERDGPGRDRSGHAEPRHHRHPGRRERRPRHRHGSGRRPVTGYHHHHRHRAQRPQRQHPGRPCFHPHPQPRQCRGRPGSGCGDRRHRDA